ncbi:MAG: GDSL-type esterase/lipase family protein [Pseudomonadota bacterium]
MKKFALKGATLAALFSGSFAGSAVAMDIDEMGCPAMDTRLVVMGDSLADGLWGSLYRVFARCDNMDVVRLTKVSDGLARTDADAWMDRFTRATPADDDAPVTDIVIVQLGANDITFLRDGSKRASFGTPEWTAAYKKRAAKLANGLSGRASAVLWFGLPIVGSTKLEPSYQEISGLLQGALKGTKASYVDIHGLTKFGAENFVMNAKFDGRTVQMRATDKVHFTTIGYDLVLGSITKELGRLFAAKDRTVVMQSVVLQ